MTKKQNTSYPAPEDDDFQLKIFKKREFYYHKIQQRDILKNYEEIKKICKIKAN